jgi:hypothetical protein
VAKVIKHIDLSSEDPGPRAALNLPQEDIEFGGELPLFGGKVLLKARVTPGSPLSRLVTAVSLIASGCACVVTLSLIGLPAWAAASTLILPAAIYLGLSNRVCVGISMHQSARPKRQR